MVALRRARGVILAAAAAAGTWHAVDGLRHRKSNATSGASAAPYDCYTGTGADYEGLTDMTASGRTCKNWVDEGTYSSTVKGIGNHNYCRNPEGSKSKPWCFTVDPQVAFELCEVPLCPADGASPEPWVAPPGSKSPEAEAPCKYVAPEKPGYEEYKAGRACMDHRGETWWLISNSNFTVADPKGCESECKTLPGTKFFTYWEQGQNGNCGCYRECVLVEEDLTVDAPTVYKVA